MAMLPQMTARQSGRIVNTTSIGGKVSVPHLVAHDSAKLAATGFSRGLRTELKQDGVPVTTTAPSLMRTGSYFNARIRGQPDKEFAWFSLGSTLPLITMDPERATRQIVQATRRGAAEQTLSVPETILAKFNGLFPGLTSDIMSRVDQYILQDADGSVDVEKEGKQFHSEFESKAQEAATLLGQRSAQRFQPERNFPQEGISDPRD